MVARPSTPRSRDADRARRCSGWSRSPNGRVVEEGTADDRRPGLTARPALAWRAAQCRSGPDTSERQAHAHEAGPGPNRPQRSRPADAEPTGPANDQAVARAKPGGQAKRPSAIDGRQQPRTPTGVRPSDQARRAAARRHDAHAQHTGTALLGGHLDTQAAAPATVRATQPQQMTR